MANLKTTTAAVLKHLAIVFTWWVATGTAVGYIVADYLIRDHVSFVFFLGAVALALVGGVVHCVSYVIYVAVLRRKAGALP